MGSKLTELIKLHEGTGPVRNGHLMPYHDGEGLLTIGYGFCLDKTGLSEGECEFILRNRTNEIYYDCEKVFDWFEQLNEARKAVIVSMIYNMGMAAFSGTDGHPGFKKTMKYLSDGDFYNASIEMLDSRWAKQVGRRAKELSSMMRTGSWL